MKENKILATAYINLIETEEVGGVKFENPELRL